MGFLEVLAIVLIVLKLTHNADYSWWVAFIPLYVAAALYFLWFAFFGAIFVKTFRR